MSPTNSVIDVHTRHANFSSSQRLFSQYQKLTLKMLLPHSCSIKPPAGWVASPAVRSLSWSRKHRGRSAIIPCLERMIGGWTLWRTTFACGSSMFVCDRYAAMTVAAHETRLAYLVRGYRRQHSHRTMYGVRSSQTGQCVSCEVNRVKEK